MLESSSQDSLNKFKNYSLNVLIILIALGSFYLLATFIGHIASSPSGNKDVLTDTVSNNRREITSSVIQIKVENGTNISGIAEKVTDYLIEQGFDVVEIGNFTTPDVNRSMVIDRAGNTKNSVQLARVLGIPEKFIIQQISKDYLLDATVVLGYDYQDLKPFQQNK